MNLSPRQRAMLAEMGIRVFLPEDPGPVGDVRPAPRAKAPVPAAAAASTRAPEPVRVAVPARMDLAEPAVAAAPLSTAVEGLDWDALQESVAQWASARRRKPVFGDGDRQPDWLCVGDPPIEEEARHGIPFAGDEGRLLDNMLAAVGASRRRGAYLTNAFKCRLPDDRGQEAAEAAHWEQVLQRQVELLQPKVILAMGRYAVQMLLQTSDPIGKLRGRVHRYAGVPVVVTYHPKYLLHHQADKARAWADLCLASELLR